MSNNIRDFFQITDPHCHLWDVSFGYHGWLANNSNQILGDVTPINKNYLAQDYLADANSDNKFNLRKFVHIESVSDKFSKTEVEWLLEQSKTMPNLGGIVAGIDLLNPNVEKILAFYQETKLVIGVRQILNFYQNPESKYSNVDQDYLNNKTWVENFSLLEKYNLMFEAQVNPTQLLNLAKLAEIYPGITININHTGFPYREFFDIWQASIAHCAQYKNINIKLSGFGMFDHDWSARSIKDSVLFVIEKFGIDRCMFASNFPVDKLYKTYCKMVNNYIEVVKDFAIEDQHKLFSLNAERIYCL